MKDDARRFRLGAVGLRKDGVIVASCNGNPRFPDRKHHAEYRVCRKLTDNSVVYVARVLADGSIGCAKPCPSCMKCLKSKGVLAVFWTEDTPNEWPRDPQWDPEWGYRLL